MSAETERSEKNLAAIKRIDPLAESILARSTHATIYDYETTETKWVKTPFEGSLFVYRRIDRPFYSLIVVNRQSLQDFIEPITEKLKIKYVAPYIYFYKPDGTIKGLWFFRPEEGQSMFELLTNLIENPLEYQKQKPKTTLGQTRGANKGKIDIGTGSVAVSANSVNWQSIAAAQPTSVHRAESLTGKRLSAVENTKEAKNGSTSENDEISSKVLQMLATLGNGTANENAVTPASKSPSLLRAQNVNAKSVEELECDLTRPPPSIEQRKEAKKQPLPVKTEPNEVEPNGSQQTVKSVTVNSLLARPEKSAPEQANINRGANAKQVVNAKVPWSKIASDISAAGSHTANTQMNASKPKPVGLTKEQLQQAIEHLLKTDAEFLDKLHVAYTESLLARFQA